MVDFLGMLIVNLCQEIGPKSSGTKRTKAKQKIGFPGAESAIGGKMASLSKILDAPPKIPFTMGK